MATESSFSMAESLANILQLSVASSTKPSMLLLEDYFNLTTEQALIPALIMFWCFTIPFYYLVERSRLPSFVMAVLFLIWMSLALGVECRVELSNSVTVKDLGQDWLAPWHEFFNSMPVVYANTAFILGLALFGVYEAFFQQRPALILRALICGVLRMSIGVLTQLPAPLDYVAVAGDWPPPPSAECAGFIFNPSGHVTASVITSMALRRQGRNSEAWFIDAGCLLQSLRLIATRGHYTVDIITAVLLSIVVDQNLPIRDKNTEEASDDKKKK